MNRRSDDDMDDELRFHHEQQTEEFIRSGMSPVEARRQASIKLGKPLPARETLQDLHPLQWFDNWIQDCHYGLRGLYRNPAFSLTALLSITLGIAATIAIFTFADNVLLRELPYQDPQRLMMLWEVRVTSDNQSNVVSPANFLEWKLRANAFESMSYFIPRIGTLSAGDQTAELQCQAVGLDLLPMLGISPAKGRLFTKQDMETTSPDSIIISYRLWQTWFGGAGNILGQKVYFDATPRTVVGVMPKGFYFRNREVDFWLPFNLDPAINYRRSSGRFLLALARLKPNVSQSQANTQLQTIARQLELDYPEFSKNWSARVESLHDSLTTEVASSLKVLLAAVGLLLAIACSNVANLLLARYASRRAEISVRLSLGASPWRLVRQVLAESLLLGMIGGLCGLVLARLLVSGLLTLAPKQMLERASIEFDSRVVFTALAISMLCGLLFGLAPAFMLFRSRLESGQRGGIASGMRLRTWLVSAEIALSVLLLIGAGLLFRSFAGLQSVQPGLDPQNLLTFRISLPPVRYTTPESRVQFYQNLLGQLGQLPGISTTSAISHLPFQGMSPGTSARLGGAPPPRPGESLTTAVRFIMPNYFNTMRIGLKAGRDFTPADNLPAAPLRFIVNESFVKLFMKGKDPLAQKIMVRMQDENPYGEIVGVVGDVKERSLDRDPRATAYYPFGKISDSSMVVLMRSAIEPNLQIESARSTLRQLDSQIPLANPHSMTEVLADTYSRQRLSSWLLSTFSLLALLLAAIGIYGIQAYAVSERTREIGVRIALGASPGNISTMILTRALRTILLGLAAGIGAAFLLSGYLKTMLFGITPYDPLSYSAVPVLLMITALVAAYFPARRAAKLDPVEALQAGGPIRSGSGAPSA